MGRRLFIGVVSHDRSRFRDAAVRQMHALAQEASTRGWNVSTLVSDRDDYDPRRWPLDRRAVWASALAQARLEREWRRYLNRALVMGRAARASRWLRDEAMWLGSVVVRSARYLAPWPGAPVHQLNGHRAVVRLINIDLSHLRVLYEAADTKADWVLVLEDDARAADPVEAMATVCSVLDSTMDELQYVNASRSIDHSELGIEQHLGPVVDGVRVARVPVTNTVCAVIYRGTIVPDLAAGIEAFGLVPAVPIDWRLNRVIMERVSTGEWGPGSCLFLDPAPFTQGSMHPPSGSAS